MPIVSSFSSGSSRSLGLGSGIRPGAPTIDSFTYLNGTTGGRLSISFTEGTVGTTATTDYQYSTDNGATWATRSGTVSPLVITGLTNGTSYTVRLRAVNSIGPSNQSNSIVGRPIALPGAPSVTVTTHATDLGTINVAVTNGTAGTDNLNASTPYEYSLNSGSTWTTVSSANFSISGLANETTYTVTVRSITTNSDRSTSGSGSGSTMGVAPIVPKPTASPSGSSYTVSWDAITDPDSGVASATLYQLFVGGTSGFVGGSSYEIPSGSFSGGSYTFTTPDNRRNTPTGESWAVTFYIIATDVRGNSKQSEAATLRFTKPLGTFYINPTDWSTWVTATSGTGSAAGWRGDLGAYGEVYVGWANTTYAYQYGHFFYGSSVYDAARGFVPNSASVRTYRSSANGCTSGLVSFATHNHGTKPTTPSLTLTNYFNGGSQSQGSAKEFALTSNALGRIAVDSNFGVFMFPGTSTGTFDDTKQTTCANGTTYRVFDSPGSGATNGRITLVFN